jgi:hypothetical protein
MRKSIVPWVRDNAVPLGIVAALGIAWLILRSPSKVAEDIGRGAVNVGRGAATGVVDEFGKIISLPSVYDVSNNPRHVRYIIDHPRGGYLRASFYATPVALAQAWALPEFSGELPPPDSRIHAEFPPTNGSGESW